VRTKEPKTEKAGKLQGRNAEMAYAGGACTDETKPAKKTQGADVVMERMDEVMVRQAVRDHEEWLKTKGKSGRRADFSKKLLIKADLINSNLEYANFDDATLINCIFSGAKINEASFKNARIIDCSFIEVFAKNANFTNAKVINCTFDFSMMEDAVFEYATADGSSFKNALLINANFDDASLVGTYFCEAIASNASFFDANMEWAHLEEAYFYKAVMCGASLRHASMNHANFKEADTYGVSWPLDYGSVGIRADMNLVKRFLAHIAGLGVPEEEEEEFFELLQAIKKYVEDSKPARELSTSNWIMFMEASKAAEYSKKIKEAEDEKRNLENAVFGTEL